MDVKYKPLISDDEEWVRRPKQGSKGNLYHFILHIYIISYHNDFIAGKLAVLALGFLLACSLAANVFFVTKKVILKENIRDQMVKSIKQTDVQNDCSQDCALEVYQAVDYCNDNTNDDASFLYCVFAIIGIKIVIIHKNSFLNIFNFRG